MLICIIIDNNRKIEMVCELRINNSKFINLINKKDNYYKLVWFSFRLKHNIN